MNKLYLCRHGKTSWNGDRRIQGLTDIELCEKGHLQAEWLAGFMKNQITAPVRIVSSPLLRASQTAQHIADALGLSVETDERVTEVNTGEFTGMKLADLKDDPRWQAHLRDPWHSGYGFGGESSESVCKRMADFIEEAKTDDRDLIIVTHASPIRHAIMNMMNIPAEHLYHIVIHNASATLFERREDFFKMVFTNVSQDWFPAAMI